MKVVPAQSPTRTAADVREVPATRTPVTREALRGAIRKALEASDGSRPSESLVDVLTAQASLETASGDRMYNYNFAGIKGRSPSGAVAVCRTHEVLGGKDVVIKDGFRAYSSLDEGARDYVKLMKSQFSGAMAPASRGDTVGFASALKRAHYYTAPEADYAQGLSNLMNSPRLPAVSGSPGIRPTATPLVLPLSTDGVSRVSDTLDAERWFGAFASSASSTSTSSSSSSSRVHRASDDDEDS